MSVGQESLWCVECGRRTLHARQGASMLPVGVVCGLISAAMLCVAPIPLFLGWTTVWVLLLTVVLTVRSSIRPRCQTCGILYEHDRAMRDPRREAKPTLSPPSPWRNTVTTPAPDAVTRMHAEMLERQATHDPAPAGRGRQ